MLSRQLIKSAVAPRSTLTRVQQQVITPRNFSACSVIRQVETRAHPSTTSATPLPSSSSTTSDFSQLEAATVRRLRVLLSQVKQRHPGIRGRLPARMSNQTWLEYLERQAAAAAQATPSSSPSSTSQDASQPNNDAQQRLLTLLTRPKRMHESHIELSLPFSSSPTLCESYVGTSGKIRLGKVFEDLDSLAGDISYQHVLGGRPSSGDTATPIFLVTAAVDRLDLVGVEHLRVDRDYRLSGLPIYVGSSSMEVLVVIDELSPSPSTPTEAEAKTVMSGRFTMVAVNGHTKRSQRIPPLEVVEEDERQLFEFGKAHKERKREEGERGLGRVPPSRAEAGELHARWLGDRRWLEERRGGEEEVVVPVSKTRLTTTEHIHPQSANIHKRLFGGYIMRQAYELAWMVAAQFVHTPVNFLALDALAFHSPVPIGAFLCMTSQIDYTTTSTTNGGTVAAISVLVETVDVGTGERKRTNTFDFSFDLGKRGGGEGKRVTPETYQEAMRWIEGKRRVELGLELRGLYEGEGRV